MSQLNDRDIALRRIELRRSFAMKVAKARLTPPRKDSVDGRSNRKCSILGMTHSATRAPFGQRSAAQAAETIAVNQPDPWTYSFQGGLGPFLPKHVLPSTEAATPPFSQRSAQLASELIAANQPEIWPFTFIGGPAPYLPRLVPDYTEGTSDPPPYDRRRAEENAQIVAFSQPDPWVYAFHGGRQPYSPAPLPPIVEGIVVPKPGAGKRRNFPSYIPQPAYDVEPRSPIKPIWDRGPAPAAEPQAPIRPAGPPPLPPLSAFASKPPAGLSLSGLPTFDEYVPHDAMAAAQRLSDALDESDAIAALRALGLIIEDK